MTITSIEPTKDKKMMRVFIDNRYAFSIPSDEYIRSHLYEEEEISEEKLQHIKKNVLVRAAREKAVRFLIARDRSEGEIIQKLIDAGFDRDVANCAAEELKAIGYIDDSRYAMKYIAERIRDKALSKKALRYELERKKISAEIIEQTLSEFETNDEEVALRAARKKFGKYNLDDVKIQQKLLRFLYHRGFSHDIAKKVLNILRNE
ncbi:MAG: regulatory protein RecX [Clostridiaceae bacterium]|nr:regulatory protein RecX [Clostridiaceae bacterium]